MPGGNASGRFDFISFTVVLIPVFTALLLAAPGLGHQVWYDESYTILNYVPGSFDSEKNPLTYPFTNYSAPNNHMLFSSMLSMWSFLFADGKFDVFSMRLLPFLLFGASVAAVSVAGIIFRGRIAGLFAGMVFATSHVALNFATELRGYCPSYLPVALCTVVILFYLRQPKRRYAVLYLLCAMAAVATIPTNLAIFTVLGIWYGMYCLSEGICVLQEHLRSVLFFVFSPLAGLFFYALVYKELLAQADRKWNSSHGAFDVVYGFEWHFFADFWWLLPFAIFAAIVILVKRRGSCNPDSRSLLLVLLAVVSLVLPFILYAIPKNVPFDRNLVPLIPLLSMVLGGLMAEFCWRSFSTRSLRGCIVIVICSLLAVSAQRREANGGYYTSLYQIGDKPEDVYHFYFQHEFDPSGVIKFVIASSNGVNPVMLTDNCDLFGLVFYKCLLDQDRFSLVYVGNEGWGFRQRPQSKVFIVANSDAGALRILEEIRRRCAFPGAAPGFILAKDTGYYNIYIVLWK